MIIINLWMEGSFIFHEHTERLQQRLDLMVRFDVHPFELHLKWINHFQNVKLSQRGVCCCRICGTLAKGRKHRRIGSLPRHISSRNADVVSDNSHTTVAICGTPVQGRRRCRRPLFEGFPLALFCRPTSTRVLQKSAASFQGCSLEHQFC